jgi:hypothetical protein
MPIAGIGYQDQRSEPPMTAPTPLDIDHSRIPPPRPQRSFGITDDRAWISGTERPACFEIVPTARGQAQPAYCALRHLSATRSLRSRDGEMTPQAHGECESTLVFTKTGLGAISSSRCQTTRARPGLRPRRSRNPKPSGRAERHVKQRRQTDPEASGPLNRRRH